MVKAVTAQRTISWYHFLCGNVQFVPSESFQLWDTFRKYAGYELASSGLLAKQCAHPINNRRFHPESTYNNTLGADFHFTIVKFSACKLLWWRKNCLHLHTLSSAYRTPCMVMPLNIQWKTSSHQFICGKFWFDPSVYFPCWDIAGIYSVWTCQMGSASKNTDRILWKLVLHSQNPLMKTLWVLILPSFKSIFHHYQVTPMNKYHAWVALIWGLLIEDPGS